METQALFYKNSGRITIYNATITKFQIDGLFKEDQTNQGNSYKY